MMEKPIIYQARRADKWKEPHALARWFRA